MSCGVGHRRGSDPELLWLWCRPAATALIQPLALELPYAARERSPKQPTTTTKNKEKRKKVISNYLDKSRAKEFNLIMQVSQKNKN